MHKEVYLSIQSGGWEVQGHHVSTCSVSEQLVLHQNTEEGRADKQMQAKKDSKGQSPVGDHHSKLLCHSPKDKCHMFPLICGS